MSEPILNKNNNSNDQLSQIDSTETTKAKENSLGRRISYLKDSLKVKNFKFYQGQNENTSVQGLDQNVQDPTENKQNMDSFAEMNEAIHDENQICEEDKRKIYEVMMIGMVVEAVVITKNEELKLIGVQLNRFHSFCDSCLSTKLQESDLMTLSSKKSSLDKLSRLYEFKIKAIIREQEIVGKIIKQ